MTAESLQSELTRRIMQVEENSRPDSDIPTPNWSTDTLTQEFEVLGFAAPLVVVRRRSTGEKGSLKFRHHPRVYYGWEPYRE